MSSEVDICNLALAHLGDSATLASLDPPEGSAQAEYCANFYSIARDAMLEMHTWKFATRRALLAQLSVESWNWAYAYAEPSGALRIVSVLDATASSDSKSTAFETMSGDSGEALILTDLDAASVVYTVAVSDTSRFSPLFVMALSWHLASLLAGPMLKGDVGAAEGKRCAQMMQAYLAQAKASDANQRNSTTEYVAGWLKAR